LGDVERFGEEGTIVLELSSFQLARLAWARRSPHLAICTNVTPNHLDWHRDFEDYAGAKENITRFQSADDLLVVNAGCPVCSAWPERSAARAARFSVAEGPGVPGAWLESGEIRVETGEVSFSLPADGEAMRLRGGHTRANAMAAALGAALLGARPGGVGAALRDFPGLPHRLEFVAERNGVGYYNDSVATTPEAALAAMRSFDSPLVVIAGGSDKGLDLAEFGRAAARRAEVLVVTGATGPAIHAAAEGTGGGARVVPAESFEDAFRAAAREARPGWTVLLSPASASFDEFPNFAARGEAFRRLVEGL
ncbi:MAG: UDP-N-acetylmuramoyl-L-alanine--D-glutamate ligase, partial [Planctomycetota bacterium]